LDDSIRQKVKDIKEKISDLQVEFSKNCTEESTKLTFTKEQLSELIKDKNWNLIKLSYFICIKEGVNENLINSLPKVNEKN
jgi:hypothetical protein